MVDAAAAARLLHMSPLAWMDLPEQFAHGLLTEAVQQHQPTG